jgi:two-component system, LytTR family, sensor kinase
MSIDKNRVRLFTKTGLAFLLLAWVIDLFAYTEVFFKRAANHAWLLIYLLAVNFILFEYSLPFIRLTWKRMLAAPLLLMAHIILFSFGLYVWRYMGIQLHIYTSLGAFKSTAAAVGYISQYGFFSGFCFGIVRYTYDHRKLKQMAQQLHIEKQEAELNYLRSQTNPHFLFNTLNNIYSLARDKSDLAPESILRLSKILRFMLYETGGDYIAIEQELKIMDDYIALEKLRYDDSLRIHFNHNIEDMKQAIPPLLLIPLVENAFKHGVSETRHQPFVDIHLSVNRRQLSFIVKNSADAAADGQPVTESIGLANLRRQLALLFTSYNLLVQQQAATFTATLNINLASHVSN